QGRSIRDHRPLWRWKKHADSYVEFARAAHPRAGLGGRSEYYPVKPVTVAHFSAWRGHGVSAFQFAQFAYRARQRAISIEVGRFEKGRTTQAGARRSGLGRLDRAHRQVSAPVVRWTAATRRHR